eukprot:COSAG06_NODE_1044_length_10979_cov_10.105331_3_plen_154_part_00
MIILPRQARDKHRENSIKECRFLAGACSPNPTPGRSIGFFDLGPSAPSGAMRMYDPTPFSNQAVLNSNRAVLNSAGECALRMGRPSHCWMSNCWSRYDLRDYSMAAVMYYNRSGVLQVRKRLVLRCFAVSFGDDILYCSSKNQTFVKTGSGQT